jgi:AraC-like DNA-binding protein
VGSWQLREFVKDIIHWKAIGGLNCFVMKEKRKIHLSKDEREQLRLLIQLMQEEPGQEYTIGGLVKTTGMNRYKLSYGFRQITGYSIHQFLIKARMVHAKKLLLETEKPTKEIAGLSGYRSMKNFITAFKNYYGKTPFQLRVKRR